MIGSHGSEKRIEKSHHHASMLHDLDILHVDVRTTLALIKVAIYMLILTRRSYLISRGQEPNQTSKASQLSGVSFIFT